MSSSPLNQMFKPAICLGGVIIAFGLYSTRQVPMEFKFQILGLILLFTFVIIFVKSLILVLCTYVLFIDMPDPDNYAAALLRTYQSKMNDNLLSRVGRKILKSLGLSLSP